MESAAGHYKPLARSAAVDKVRAFATERGLTQDNFFPAPIDSEADFEHDPTPGFDERYFPEFSYEDAFGYIFLEELKKWRDELDAEIYEIKRESIERAHAFIAEYALTKEDIFPIRDQER